MATPLRNDGALARERAARQRTLIADVLESLRIHPLDSGAPSEGGPAESAVEQAVTVARIGDLIAAATELARLDRDTPSARQHSLGAGVLASLLFSHRPMPRIDHS